MDAYRKRLPQTISTQEWDAIIKIAQSNPETIRRFIDGQSSAPDALSIEHLSNRPLSVEELAALYSIDLAKFEPAYIKPNIWPIGAKFKHPDGTVEILTQNLYQSKVTFRPIRTSILEEIKALLLDSRSTAPMRFVEADDSVQEYACEIDIFDFHLGKIAVDEDWSLDAAREIWMTAINSLLSRIPLHQIARFVLPCGNDYLHVDNSKGLTYNGTAVGSNPGFYKLLIFGKELFCETINMLLQYADVVVPVIPGNHDRDASFAVGDLIAERFRDNPRVKVLNSGKMRVYWRYGTNLLGFTHGNTVNLKNIAGLMPIEAPMDYAATTYRAIKTGHLHYRQKNQMAVITQIAESNGIDVEIVPSLAPKDGWHEDMGFVGALRRAKACLYHHTRGLDREIWYTYVGNPTNQSFEV